MSDDTGGRIVREAGLEPHAHIKIAGRVIIQLGSELVTDVEQAILECVKNAYDADSPGCSIEVDTTEVGTIEDSGSREWLEPFLEPAEGVNATLTRTQAGQPDHGLDPTERVTRTLTYNGRVTIVDAGDGISEENIHKSWLVVSSSGKRVQGLGPKQTTRKGRTPLGDKGLGRLGTMKIGDILHVESAQSPTSEVAHAHFRWKDCEIAESIDLVPVVIGNAPNVEGLKGTRVSVLGLHDLPNWRQPDRPDKLMASLAGLISPFESTSTFPVSLKFDGVEHSLVKVTDELLKSAVAKFTFRWETHQDKKRLVARAAFKKSLLTTSRSETQRARSTLVFGRSNADEEFVRFLNTYSRTKGYHIESNVPDGWFVEFERTYPWSKFMLDTQVSIEDPGTFEGAFYFFHIDRQYLREAAVANPAALKTMVDKMAGISLLRDGFRIRSSSDWLGLSEGMTSGSTYGMRFNNTVGYFALNGQNNYRLVEKSDREGFIDNSAYRGFHSIAKICLDFSNEALESIRRAVDECAKQLAKETKSGPLTPAQSVTSVERIIKAADSVRQAAGDSALGIQKELDTLADHPAPAQEQAARAIAIAERAMGVVAQLQQSLHTETAADAIGSIREDQEDQRELVTSLIESAAIGLSARGLAHELRTHLTEIRKRLAAIQALTRRKVPPSTRDYEADIRAIKLSCSAISGQASLLDPMLPRTRAMKDTFDVFTFINEYIEARRPRFDRNHIKVEPAGKNDSLTVRMNQARLLQVIDNLVSNSIYWLNRAEMTGDLSGGKVIEIVTTPSGFVVSDSGMGVEPHYEASLFDMFVSAKPQGGQGQGLGLFISRQLLALDGCEIYLDGARNSHGRLYRFVINLSAVDARN